MLRSILNGPTASPIAVGGPVEVELRQGLSGMMTMLF